MKRLFLFLLITSLFGMAQTSHAEIEVTDELSISGSLRLRNEFYSAPNFDSDLDGDNFSTLRTSVALHLKPTDNIQAVVEMRAWNVLGEENILSDPDTNNDIDLYQAYGVVNLTDNLFVKAGRMEVSLGTERLFSNYDEFKGLYHDAAIIGMTGEGWLAALYGVKWNEASAAGVNPSGGGSVGGRPAGAGVDENDNHGVGFHAMIELAEGRVFNGNITGIKLNGLATDPTIYSFSGAWDDEALDLVFYGAEGVLQVGTADVGAPDDADIFAGALHLRGGLKFNDNTQRVWVALNMASGSDNDPDELEAFNTIFGDSQGELGMMDLVAWQNIFHVGFQYHGKFMDEALGLHFGLHYFSLYEEFGGIFLRDVATGFVNQVGTGNGDDTALAFEVDAAVDYTFNERVNFYGQFGVFMPQDYFQLPNGDDGDPIVLLEVGGKVMI